MKDRSKNDYEAPFFDGLLTYRRNPGRSFHTPGHKSGRGLEAVWSTLGNWAELDLTEISGFDWEGNLRAAEAKAAQLFAADTSFFLTQGATQGILGGMLGAFAPGSRVLVARNCHVAVSKGLILADLEPVYLEVDWLSDWDLPVGINLESLAQALIRYPDACGLILTNPTYQGIATALHPIREVLGERILFVDEAHGGHLGWSGRPGYEASAVADLWVQGTHKIHGSLTQTGLLHLSGKRLTVDRIRQGMELISSTSPSFLFMASLDSTRRYLASEGRELFQERLPRVAELKQRISRLPGFVLLDETVLTTGVLDPWKIVLATDRCSGLQLERILVKQFQIQPEYADQRQVTLFLTPWQEPASWESLYQALQWIGNHAVPETAGSDPQQLRLGIPPLRMKPRAAVNADAELVGLNTAAGRIAAAALIPYPPGIPVIAPGELVRSEEVDGLLQLARCGGAIRGVTADGMIKVVKD